MNADDMERVCELVKLHFTKATTADAELTWEQVRGYGLGDAEHAIKTHRIECGKFASRPDISRIRVLAATEYRNRRPPPKNETIWESVCKPLPLTYPGKDRVADLILHFTTAWDTVKASDNGDRGRAGGRAYICGAARRAFVEEGMPDADAEATARWVVELGERDTVNLSPLLNAIPPAPETSGPRAAAMQILSQPEPSAP